MTDMLSVAVWHDTNTEDSDLPDVMAFQLVTQWEKKYPGQKADIAVAYWPTRPDCLFTVELRESSVDDAVTPDAKAVASVIRAELKKIRNHA